ncbi:MAG: DUF58 domain-containing protein [Chitinophagales bacterium]|nr:DUF58 domain-containing protein [Chitinophagales bacterium]
MIKELNSIDKLDLLAKKIVEGYLIGLHRSPFHGFSAEFREHKQYNLGDNLKSIDYKVFARTDKLFIKKYDEETNLRCQLVIDVSSSMYFPKENPRTKLEFSSIAAASLIHLLKKQRDAFGLTLFSDSILQNIEPKLTEKNKQLIYTALNNYLQKENNHSTSNIIECIHGLAYSLKRRTLVVIFTDLLNTTIDDSFDEKFVKALQHLAFQKHDLILFYVHQKKTEIELDYGIQPTEFIDMETGEKIKLIPSELQSKFQKAMEDKINKIKTKCIQYGVDFVEADINQDYNQILSSFLRKRTKMLK